MIIFLFLTVLIQIPVSDGIMTGMVVTVEVADQKIQVGGFSAVTVKVEYNDGESLTPRDLVEVTLSVTAGTFEPASAITDVHGQCTFTYNAPDEVDGPTDVTITATAENGVLDPTGSDEVTVTYRLEGVIMGPSQVEAGGKSENYVLKVTAGGTPVPNVNVMPTVFGAGTLGTYSRTTNATGEAVMIIHPGDVTGQINILVQLGSQNYCSTAASKAVYVVEELAPLEIRIILGPYTMANWGASRITARMVRGEDPVGGIPVYFRSSLGYFLYERVLSDQNGNATGIFIASHDTNWSIYEVNINISTGDGVETAYFEGILEVHYNDVTLDLDFGYIPSGFEMQSQLYPGEQLMNEPKITGMTGYAADMTLKFHLYGGAGADNYTSVLATGLSTFDLIDGSFKEVIYQPGRISVYTVPDDPVEGIYLYRYTLTDRTGNHKYKTFTPYRPDSFDPIPIQVNIHGDGQNDWTFMYYLAGDNDLAPYMDLELERLENEAPNGQFKVYVMFDRSIKYDDISYYDGEKWRGAKKFDLEEGRESGTGPDWVSSSTARYLYDFMLWVSHRSPSGHYGLVLSDHGKGYKGMCWDERWENSDGGFPPPDHLSLHAIRNALQMFNAVRRKVDVVTLAACGMSGIEIASNIGTSTDYIVASQLPTFSDRGLTTQKVLEHLKGYDWDSYSPTPFQVSVDFVNGFIERSGGTQYDSSVCVIDTDHVLEFSNVFNSTMRSIYNNWELLGESFSTAYDRTTRVPGPELGEFENGDLREFLVDLREEVSGLILDPTGRSVFNKLGDCIEKFDEIVAYAHLIQGLNGINLYMPVEPIPTDLGIFSWDYFGTLPFSVDYYMCCLVMNSGGSYLLQGGDNENDFTPLDPVDGYIIDDDNDGMGNVVVINLTPSQNIEQQPAFRVVIDCLLFSGNGGGYLSDMLKKRIVYEKDDFEGLNRIEVALPVSGWYTVMARVLDQNNEVVQKFIVGNYTMEGTQPEGAPPSLEISASETTITVGDEIDLSASISDPDGDDVDVIWDFDHRDGVLFDSGEEEASCRYLRSGNVTVTCIATDGENTVVETIDIIVEPAVGNNAPTAKMTSDVNEHGVVALDAGALSSDPDGDMLLYKFNFGDGNWTDWMEEGEAEHHYKRVGTYNCSVRVMDIRGAGSERYFLLVDVLNVSNQTGGDDDDNGSETGAGVIIIVVIATGALFLGIVVVFAMIFILIRKKRGVDEEEDAETW